MNITIKHIAEHVGLSKQAVSFALNNTPGQVSEATRERVLKAAKTMGYQPNWRARSFARQRSQTIGLVYGRPADYVQRSQIVSALVQQLAALDRELMLIPATGPVEKWGHKLRDGRVDGVLITHPVPLGLETFVAAHQVPAIFLNLRSELDVPQVYFDDAAGTRLAVQHLLDLGHQRITYFCQTKAHGEHYSNADRREAYAAAMLDANLEAHLKVVGGKPGDFAVQLAALAPAARPTALLVYNDHDAIQLMQSLWREGLRVPQDLSVVGFNNDPAASDSVPPLTTVTMPVDDLVRCGLNQLLGTDDASSSAVFPLTLTLRESTAPVSVSL